MEPLNEEVFLCKLTELFMQKGQRRLATMETALAAQMVETASNLPPKR
jgi:hypothetical protein